MSRKLKKEKPYILFLQETKCKPETFDKLGKMIWKVCKTMEVDSTGMAGGMTIIWKTDLICLTDWRENLFSLLARFTIMELREKGTLSNMYDPSYFPKKPVFIELLSWIKHQIGDSMWIVYGDFNLITFLGENKGVRRSMDRF